LILFFLMKHFFSTIYQFIGHSIQVSVNEYLIGRKLNTSKKRTDGWWILYTLQMAYLQV